MTTVSMTESLATGLSNRFFSETRERTARTLQALHSQGRRHKAWDKLVPFLRSSMGNGLICAYEGGSKRNPYFAFDVLNAIPEREYNSWNEKCLTAVSGIFVDKSSFVDCLQGCYSIGEHAVRRLFLRTQPSVVGTTIDAQAIVRQLRHVPTWSNFWFNALLTTERINLYDECNPMVPAPTGVFLAEYNKVFKGIEIRTFVDEGHLAEEQRQARQLMLDVGAAFEPSPLCFTLVVNRSAVDDWYYLYSCMAHQVLTHPYFPALANSIFHKVENDRARLEAKRSFESQLKEDAQKAMDGGLNAVLKQLGLAKFLLVARQSIQRAGGRALPVDAL